MGIELTNKDRARRETIQSKLAGKSGGRHMTGEVLDLAALRIDPETDSGKIALKCQDCVFCLRDHADYANYRISDRSDCPKSCTLNPTYG